MGDTGYSMLVGNVGLLALIYTALGLISYHIGHLPGMYQSHDEHCTGSLLKNVKYNVRKMSVMKSRLKGEGLLKK